ncbi:MAG: hypothetical protein WCW02_02200 [Candidatus Buchananbacteria bacterium]
MATRKAICKYCQHPNYFDIGNFDTSSRPGGFENKLHRHCAVCKAEYHLLSNSQNPYWHQTCATVKYLRERQRQTAILIARLSPALQKELQQLKQELKKLSKEKIASFNLPLVELAKLNERIRELKSQITTIIDSAKVIKVNANQITPTPEKIKAKKLIIVCDVDGVMRDIINPLVDYCNSRWHLNYDRKNFVGYDSIFDHPKMPVDAKKTIFSDINFWQGRTPYLGVEVYLPKIIANGIITYACTHQDQAVEHLVPKWFKQFNLPITEDKIIFAKPEEKIAVCQRLNTDWLVEDNPQTVLQAAQAGLKVIAVIRPYNREILKFKSEFIFPVKNWKEIYNLIEQKRPTV